jgi:hypothetical protein
MKKIAIITSLLCVAASCTSESNQWFSAPGYVGEPIELDGALAFKDDVHGSMVIVDPGQGAGETGKRRFVRVPIGSAIHTAVSIPGLEDPTRRRVVVMDDLEGTLSLLSDKTGNAATVETEIPVDTFLFRDDGHFAVAFDMDGNVAGDQFISFPNAVSVVNLETNEPVVQVVRVGEASARPNYVSFAEPTAFSSRTDLTDFAILFVDNGVVALDLQAGETGRVIPLGSDEDPMVPAEAIFSNNQNDAIVGTNDDVERVFIRTHSGRLVVLTVEPNHTGKLDVSLDNIITPSVAVQDIELFFTDGGEPKLLCATSAGLVVVNGYTGVAESYPLEAPISKLAKYTEADTGKSMAIAWNGQYAQKHFYLIEPGALRRGRSRGVQHVAVSQPIASIDLSSTRSRAILHYSNQQELGLVSLTSERTTDDLRLSTSLRSHTIDPDGQRILLSGYIPSTGKDLFASLELDVLQNTSVELDKPGVAVGKVGDYYWIQHDSSHGSVTFIPTESMNRESALRFENFFLFDILPEDVRQAEEK